VPFAGHDVACGELVESVLASDVEVVAVASVEGVLLDDVSLTVDVGALVSDAVVVAALVELASVVVSGARTWRIRVFSVTWPYVSITRYVIV
jgi:hypothetical protein